MVNAYDAFNGKVQLVWIPQYVDVSIDGTLTAAPWDGTTGGVLIFEASGTVTFNADADVTGLGFAGGATLHHNGCTNGGAGSPAYRCEIVDECGGNKGTSIADNGGFELGRGALRMVVAVATTIIQVAEAEAILPPVAWGVKD
jgi:hypothetical protein